MRNKDYMDLMVEFQHKFSPHKWRVESVHLWPMIRISWTMAMHFSGDKSYSRIDRKGLVGKSSLSRLYNNITRKLGEFYSCYRAKYQDRGTNQYALISADVLFFTYSINRSKLKGCWYNRLTSRLFSYFQKNGFKCLNWERGNYGDYRIPRSESSAFYQTEIDICIQLSRFKAMPVIEQKTKDEIQRGIDWVSSMTSNSVELPGLDFIHKQSRILLNLKNFFVSKLRQVRPKLVFTTCYYSIDSWALMAACHELGIITVDLQHGQQGSLHQAYGLWGEIPVNGYEIMPNYFWNWRKEDSEAIMQWASGTSKHEAFAVGNLWINEWIQDESEIVQLYDQILNESIDESVDLNLLFTVHLDYLPEFQWEVIRRSPSNWKWWIRLHPSQLDLIDKVKNFVGETRCQVDIDLATSLPLYALLRMVNIHFTGWSSTMIEAEQMGVKSIFMDPKGMDFCPNVYQRGNSFLGDNAELVMELIESQNNLVNPISMEEVGFVGTEETKNHLEKTLEKLVDSDN